MLNLNSHSHSNSHSHHYSPLEFDFSSRLKIPLDPINFLKKEENNGGPS